METSKVVPASSLFLLKAQEVSPSINTTEEPKHSQTLFVKIPKYQGIGISAQKEKCL